MRSLFGINLVGAICVLLIIGVVGVGVLTLATQGPVTAPTLVLKDNVSVSAVNNISPNYLAGTGNMPQNPSKRVAKYQERMQNMQSAFSTIWIKLGK